MSTRSPSTARTPTDRNTEFPHVSVSKVARQSRDKSRLGTLGGRATSSNPPPRTAVHATIRTSSGSGRSVDNVSNRSSNALQSIPDLATAGLKSDSMAQLPSASSSVSANVLQAWQGRKTSRKRTTSAEPIPLVIRGNERHDGVLLQKEQSSLDTKEIVITDDLIQKATTMTSEERFSSTQDFHRVARNNRKKKEAAGYLRCLWSCHCLLVSLLTALLLGLALTAILLLIMLKPQPTSVTSRSTTTVSTTSVTTPMTTTTPTTSTTPMTTVTTTATSPTTTTSIVCTPPVNSNLNYTALPNSYMFVMYNYTATFTGPAVLEFGFTGQTGNDYWGLDDVSLLDTNASNLEMLINGNFENGTLDGWQVLCTANCQSASPPGALSTSSCHTGSFCYTDGCKLGFDFLRQVFSMTIGHVYTLSFWIKADSRPQQHASVQIF